MKPPLITKEERSKWPSHGVIKLEKPFIDVSKPALRIGEYVSVRNDPVQGQVSGHYYHYHHYLHYHYYHHIKKMMKGVLVKQVERI